MRFRKYKNRLCRYSHFQLTSNQTEKLFSTRSIVYKDQYVLFVCMPPPVPNPLNFPISHTFLQTMYVQMQQKTEGLQAR